MTATDTTFDTLPPSITIPGADHDVPVRIFAGGPGSAGLLVWAHGGSWHSGATAGWAPALTRRLAIKRLKLPKTKSVRCWPAPTWSL